MRSRLRGFLRKWCGVCMWYSWKARERKALRWWWMVDDDDVDFQAFVSLTRLFNTRILLSFKLWPISKNCDSDGKSEERIFFVIKSHFLKKTTSKENKKKKKNMIIIPNETNEILFFLFHSIPVIHQFQRELSN